MGSVFTHAACTYNKHTHTEREIYTVHTHPTYNTLTGNIASRLKQMGAVHCMAFSSDGRYLALSRPEAPIDVYEFPSFDHRIVCWYVWWWGWAQEPHASLLTCDAC